MSMNFDNYSTSFQSLMQPMYNVNANYTGYGYGAGIGANGYGAGYGMGYMSPMMNVGIGQFNADYLIKNDDKNNNYYTRPVAAHKKKDETGTMLGILGTALGTIALLAALRKGKAPRRGVTPTPAPKPSPITDPSRLLGPATNSPAGVTGGIDYIKIPGRKLQPTGQAGVKPGTQFPYNPAPVNPMQLSSGNVIPPSRQLPYTPAAGAGATTAGNVIPPSRQLSYTPTLSTMPSSGSVATDITIIPGNPRPKIFPQSVGEYVNCTELPNRSSIVPTGVPQVTVNNSKISGFLPASNGQANALAKQQAAMNLPSSGQVIEMGCSPEAYTRAGKMTPKAQAVYDAVSANQFDPAKLRKARRADARAAFPSTLQMAQEKLNQVRPDLANSGNVVYTTHTPESIANGYSIGSNAKVLIK